MGDTVGDGLEVEGCSEVNIRRLGFNDESGDGLAAEDKIAIEGREGNCGLEGLEWPGQMAERDEIADVDLKFRSKVITRGVENVFELAFTGTRARSLLTTLLY